MPTFSDIFGRATGYLFGGIPTSPDAGQRSLVGDIYGIGTSFIQRVASNTFETAAGIASDRLFGKDRMPEFGSPKGTKFAGRARTPAQAGKGMRSTAVDLGFTSSVQNAGRIAQRGATPGTPIAGVFERLAIKKAKGPLLRIAQTPIRVRKRGVS